MEVGYEKIGWQGSDAWEDYTLGFPSAGSWRVCFNSDSRHYDSEFSDCGSSAVQAEPVETDGLSAGGTIRVAAYSALILTQDEN